HIRLAVPDFRKDYRHGDVDGAVCSSVPAVHDNFAFRIRSFAGSGLVRVDGPQRTGPAYVRGVLDLCRHVVPHFTAGVFSPGADGDRHGFLDFIIQCNLADALRVSQENLGVPREINTFVLTVGATANQNGTALYEGVTVLFLAQLSGVDLTLGQQVLVAYLAILGGVGTAGVPSGSIPFIIVVLTTIGVNPSLIALILGVDRILDMCRTTLNVTGDITAATYVARSEGYKLLETAN